MEGFATVNGTIDCGTFLCMSKLVQEKSNGFALQTNPIGLLHPPRAFLTGETGPGFAVTAVIWAPCRTQRVLLDQLRDISNNRITLSIHLSTLLHTHNRRLSHLPCSSILHRAIPSSRGSRSPMLKHLPSQKPQDRLRNSLQ